jgi:hypothetical protein
MFLVTYIYPLILKLYFSELSALISLSNAPPYSDSLLPRESLVLYT